MTSVSSVEAEGSGQGHPRPPFRLVSLCFVNHTCPPGKKKIPLLAGSASDPRMVGGAAAVTRARGARSLPLAVTRPASAPELPFPLTSPASSV